MPRTKLCQPVIDELQVSIAEQKMRAYSAGQLNAEYVISTAKNGAGEQKNSGCTPLGKHYIRAKIGDGLPELAVLRGRRWTGEVYSPQLGLQFPERDWILGRILWLSGLELGKNRLGQVDTFQRYIYIHGTNELELLGQPVSHGCIRMDNSQLLQLFERVHVGTKVYIAA